MLRASDVLQRGELHIWAAPLPPHVLVDQGSPLLAMEWRGFAPPSGTWPRYIIARTYAAGLQGWRWGEPDRVRAEMGRATGQAPARLRADLDRAIRASAPAPEDPPVTTPLLRGIMAALQAAATAKARQRLLTQAYQGLFPKQTREAQRL